MAKDKLLKEELKRHIQLLEYTFYTEERPGEESKDVEDLLFDAQNQLNEQDPVEDEAGESEDDAVLEDPFAEEGGEEETGETDPFADEGGMEVEDEFADETEAGGDTVEVDVTDNIKWDTENILCVGVRSKTIADEVTTGCRYAMHDIGGILRKLYLVALPLARLHVETDFDKEYRDAILRIFLNVNFYNDRHAVIKFVVIDAKAKEVLADAKVKIPETVQGKSFIPIVEGGR